MVAVTSGYSSRNSSSSRGNPAATAMVRGGALQGGSPGTHWGAALELVPTAYVPILTLQTAH